MKTLIPLALLLSSCSPIHTLTQEDRKLLKKYPDIILFQTGKSHLIKARNIEITDSIRKAQELDLAQEYLEEQYLED